MNDHKSTSTARSNRGEYSIRCGQLDQLRRKNLTRIRNKVKKMERRPRAQNKGG